MTLPKIAIDEIIPETVVVEVIEKDCIDGNVSEKELKIISQIISYFKPHSIFEFGTFDGRTTINMAINAPADAKIYTLDLPASQATIMKYPLATTSQYSDMTYINKTGSGARYKGREESKKIIQLYGDSATFDYVPYKEKLDMIFIDGSHAREYTENDTEAALSMVRLGGIILWHDYESVWPDVTAVLDEYAEKNNRCAGMKHIENTSLVILQ